MRATIDGGGRVVIPKPVRDQLGLKPGGEVELVVRGGELSIVPVVPAQRLVRKGRSIYAESSAEAGTLDAALVRDVLESTRR